MNFGTFRDVPGTPGNVWERSERSGRSERQFEASERHFQKPSVRRREPKETTQHNS